MQISLAVRAMFDAYTIWWTRSKFFDFPNIVFEPLGFNEPTTKLILYSILFNYSRIKDLDFTFMLSTVIRRLKLSVRG